MNKQEECLVHIDEPQIMRLLEKRRPDPEQIREILAKALELKGLDSSEVATLIAVDDPDLLSELFSTARRVKQAIYGPRIVLFAPLYISNLCTNECLYCGFRAGNREVTRRVLSQEEIAAEVKILVEQGHKRILLVAGESYPDEGFDYIIKAIGTVYKTRSGHGEIRRVNVNIAPLSLEEFRQLKDAGIGTYQLFQETYHRGTYAHMHPAGRKRNYAWRIEAFDRAMQAGIDDVGIGVLFGLYDWRFEVLATLGHINHLESTFGVGPHTISVPRLEPTTGSDIACSPPHPVSDSDFCKIVAIFRMAVPYTGIIMSTRENEDVRRATLALGVSQISAGSRTNPGGYADGIMDENAQFQLGDHRNLDEVIGDLATLGYIPSFCTACYRLGRTGEDFMAVAKPGDIKYRCDPNALSTFLEYLIDYAPAETQTAGERLISSQLERMSARERATASKMLDRVRAGNRDVYV
ncbi:MAG: [FeFe] hydrogenase H-cluster radical SAM maturase HydG [Desulfobacteraceae bacterium]|nr:[FeFe] hydrogenase H-cluster radical SAM maturase HydG [Desulfobacteraceae bacterium]